jgi:hypothetical protein
MASKSKAGDKFANIAFLSVTESAANTLTFKALAMANNLLSEKAAIIIHRAEWQTNARGYMNSTGDYHEIVLALSDRITAIYDLSQPEILMYNSISRLDLGVAASGLILDGLFARDFTSLPGGGVIVPADRLYIGAQGTGLSAASVTTMRIYYTVLALDVSDYWELIEARRVMTT